MCHLVVDAVAKGNTLVLADVRTLVNEADYTPSRCPRGSVSPWQCVLVAACPHGSVSSWQRVLMAACPRGSVSS